MQVSDVEALLVAIRAHLEEAPIIDNGVEIGQSPPRCWAAHELEDAMTEKVLRAIAEGCDNGPELAKTALKSLDIEFDHWYV